MAKKEKPKNQYRGGNLLKGGGGLDCLQIWHLMG